jgi:hypothetical protein
MIIKESLNKTAGYIQFRLNGKTSYKHRILAEQYIPNPDRLEQIDHKNGIRSDNRLINLRWASPSENMRNVKSNRGNQFEYFDELPVPCEPFVFYNGHEFEGYSIDEEMNIYFHNGLMFRKLQILIMMNRYSFDCLTSIEGKNVRVFLNKLD